jgi:hypothetical protein
MNTPAQLAMLETTVPSSLPIGLTVILPKPCSNCGSDSTIVGSSAGPHYARLNCECCGRHRGWLSGTTYKFLSDVIANFGQPIEPICIRYNQSSPPGADATAQAVTALTMKGT